MNERKLEQRRRKSLAIVRAERDAWRHNIALAGLCFAPTILVGGVWVYVFAYIMGV